MLKCSRGCGEKGVCYSMSSPQSLLIRSAFGNPTHLRLAQPATGMTALVKMLMSKEEREEKVVNAAEALHPPSECDSIICNICI